MKKDEKMFEFSGAQYVVAGVTWVSARREFFADWQYMGLLPGAVDEHFTYHLYKKGDVYRVLRNDGMFAEHAQAMTVEPSEPLVQMDPRALRVLKKALLLMAEHTNPSVQSVARRALEKYTMLTELSDNAKKWQFEKTAQIAPPPGTYALDADKIKDVADVREVLRGLNLYFREDAPGFNTLVPYGKKVSS